jgi:hypothetical protein
MNNPKLTRTNFLKSTAILSGSLLLPWYFIKSAAGQSQKPDPIKPELVKAFVGKGHGDLEGVKQMLNEIPGILNACWDWGGGDFETALGGASHMGRKDIAEYLIEQGARMDIFAAAMLGQLEIVKSMVMAYPEILQSKGAHGITLLTHAQKGGDNALPVVEFLKSKGIQQ